MHYQSRYCSSFRSQAYSYIIPAAPSDKESGKGSGYTVYWWWLSER